MAKKSKLIKHDLTSKAAQDCKAGKISKEEYFEKTHAEAEKEVKEMKERIDLVQELSEACDPENMRKRDEEMKKTSIPYEKGLVYLENCIVKEAEFLTESIYRNNGIIGPGSRSSLSGYKYMTKITIKPNEGVESLIYEGAHVHVRKGDKIKVQIAKVRTETLLQMGYFDNYQHVYYHRDNFNKEEKALEVITADGQTYKKGKG